MRSTTARTNVALSDAEGADMLQLEGTLDRFALSELLAMMIASSVTGVLEVEGVPAGRIFCRDGELYHAEAGELVGIAALHALSAHTEALFRFSSGVEPSAQTLHQDSWRLVGLAERDQQLWARTRQHIPSMAWVVELCPDTGVSVQLDLVSWPLITAIDGRRSVVEIAALIGQEPQEVGAELCELIERRLVELKPPCLEESTPISGASQVPTFFDRLLSGQLTARRTERGRGPIVLRWLAEASW
jgi:hypothetical protein